MADKQKLNRFDRAASEVQPDQPRKGAGARLAGLVAAEEGELCALLSPVLRPQCLFYFFPNNNNFYFINFNIILKYIIY